jgi:TRAP-type mannitol/chloroaromatic compound transport system substrate-binding protein
VHNLAAGEASQVAALKEIEANGVQLHRWPDDLLAEFAAAWSDVVAELAAEDPEFARAWPPSKPFATTTSVGRASGTSNEMPGGRRLHGGSSCATVVRLPAQDAS